MSSVTQVYEFFKNSLFIRFNGHFPGGCALALWPKWLGRWICDQQVTGSNPGFPAVECNPGQVVNTHVPLSSSSIIWYQPMGSEALWLGR